MNIFKILAAPFVWLGKAFKTIKDDYAKVAIVVTQQIKSISESTIVGSIASVIDNALKTHLAEDVLSLAKTTANKILSVELALTGLSDNPTEAEILAFETLVFKTISGLTPSGKSKLWTTFAAQFSQIIKPIADGTVEPSFAELVKDVEAAYQAFVKDKAEADAEASQDATGTDNTEEN